MVIVQESDKHKFYDKQRKVDIIKYSTGVTKTQFDGGAFILPRKLYDGDGLFNNIVQFVSNNKDTIEAITKVASSVANTIGKVGSTTLDIVKKASSGFYYV